MTGPSRLGSGSYPLPALSCTTLDKAPRLAALLSCSLPGTTVTCAMCFRTVDQHTSNNTWHHVQTCVICMQLWHREEVTSQLNHIQQACAHVPHTMQDAGG